MKKRHFLVNLTMVLAVLLISGPAAFSQTDSALSQAHFEGAVTYGMHLEDHDLREGAREFTLYVKGGQTRLEVSSERADVTVIGSAADSVFTLLEIMGRKIALRMDAGQIKAAQERLGQFRLVHLSGERKILGYECGKALMIREGSGDSSEIWYTTELPPIGVTSAEFLPRMENYFPMEITTENEGVQLTMRVQEIKPGPVATGLFDIPTGYKIVDVDGLRAGLQMLVSP